MVSHELRTPLTAIKEGVTIVSDETAGELNSDQKEFLDMARRNVDRLVRLINDVLNFQALDSAGATLAIKGNHINEVVQGTYETHLPVAEEKGLDFTLKLADDLPELTFDKDKIIQVLTNIIDNAIKFTEKGSITLTTERNGNVVLVSAQDTGPGIKEQDMHRLFQGFERLGKPGKTAAPGTGLGLAISKQIIAMHKGKIWAESEYGKGTTFHFLLPIKDRRAR